MRGAVLQGWSRERAFVFDVVAASALCEKPDYDALGLVVALTAAQAWAKRLQVRLFLWVGGQQRGGSLLPPGAPLWAGVVACAARARFVLSALAVCDGGCGARRLNT